MKTIAPGKQRGHVLCFSRSQILRHEVVNGLSVALVSFQSSADQVVTRGSSLSATELASLRERYVVCANGAPQTYQDEHGGCYFAIPVAKVAA